MHFFYKNKKPSKPAEQNKSCGRHEFVVQDKMRPERISAFKTVCFIKLKEIKCTLKNKKTKNNSQLIAVEYIRERKKTRIMQPQKEPTDVQGGLEKQHDQRYESCDRSKQNPKIDAILE